jgi:hypothetical protein
MRSYDLPIHFGNDQGKHAINADSLAVFIDSYKEIFEELTGSKIVIEIGIPTEGGWQTRLAVIGGAIVSFIGIDNASIVVRGKPSADLFYAANDAIKGFITQEAAATSEEYPRKCIEQKNKIYQQFQKDNCIDSFDLGDIAPIPKRNFNLYIRKLPDDESIYLGIAQITVSSPVWNSKSKRSWLGNIDIIEDAERAFDFDKDLTGKFWEHVKLDTLPLHTTDEMSVQLIHRPSSRVKYRVIRVLKYNDLTIDSPLSDEDISKLSSNTLADQPTKTSIGQFDLFTKNPESDASTDSLSPSEAQDE